MKKLVNRKNYQMVSHILFAAVVLLLIAGASLGHIVENAEKEALANALNEYSLAKEQAERDGIAFEDTFSFSNITPQRPEMRTAATICFTLCGVLIVLALALSYQFWRCPQCDKWLGNVRGGRITHCPYCGGELDL